MSGNIANANHCLAKYIALTSRVGRETQHSAVQWRTQGNEEEDKLSPPQEKDNFMLRDDSNDGNNKQCGGRDVHDDQPVSCWLSMFLCIRAGSGASWRQWYDGGCHGSSCFIVDVCFVCDIIFYAKIHFPATIRFPLVHLNWLV